MYTRFPEHSEPIKPANCLFKYTNEFILKLVQLLDFYLNMA